MIEIKKMCAFSEGHLKTSHAPGGAALAPLSRDKDPKLSSHLSFSELVVVHRIATTLLGR